MIIPTQNALALSTQSISIVANVESEMRSVNDSSTNDVGNAIRLLYITHFVAKFAELVWKFCSTLVLVALTNYKSMVLVSSYGLFTGSIVCLFGPLVGSIIDDVNRNRLNIALLFNSVQNLSIILQAVCCFFLMLSVPSTESSVIHSEILKGLAPPSTIVTWLLIAAIHIFGSLESLASQSLNIAMERDWIVVMSKVIGMSKNNNVVTKSMEMYPVQEYEDEQFSELSALTGGSRGDGGDSKSHEMSESTIREKIWLTNTNTIMTQIDLACSVAAPTLFGYVFSYFDTYVPGSTDRAIPHTHWYHLSIMVMMSGILNLIALLVESRMFQRIYEHVPGLASRNHSEHDTETNLSITVPSSSEEEMLEAEYDFQVSEHKDRKNIFSFPQFGVYLEQPISFGGLALSLLYINALTFGPLMTAYLVFRGMSFGTIGFLKGVSFSVGLMGTVAYSVSSRHLSLLQTGRWSISFQFSCLALCFISLYIPVDRNLSLALLIVGVIASRIGLFVFDLTIRQLMQQTIPEHLRGVIGGIQNSLNGIFDLIMYLLGLLYSTPADFHVLATTGFVSVGIAMCIYIWGSYRYQSYVH